MNSHCNICDVEQDCGYEYKPTECCSYRKYRPKIDCKPIIKDEVTMGIEPVYESVYLRRIRAVENGNNA